MNGNWERNLGTSLEGSCILYFFLSLAIPHIISTCSNPSCLQLSSISFYILLPNYSHQYSTEAFKTSIDLWHVTFSYDPLPLPIWSFGGVWGCRVLSLCSACDVYTSAMPFSPGFLLLWPSLFKCPCWLLFFFFPTQCQCHLDWVFHFLTFLSLRFVLSISPFEGRTFRERERAQPLSLAQTFMLFHILSLCKHYCYFLEMTCTFFCNNLSLLFPNTVPVFKLGAFWVSVGWLRCSYSVFSEKSCLPLFPQSNVTPVSLYNGISSWRAGINQQWNVSPSIGQGT